MYAASKILLYKLHIGVLFTKKCDLQDLQDLQDCKIARFATTTNQLFHSTVLLQLIIYNNMNAQVKGVRRYAYSIEEKEMIVAEAYHFSENVKATTRKYSI